MTDLTMSQFASKDDLIAAQAARIAELEAELEAVGAGGVQRLSAAPQAVQAAVPAGGQSRFKGEKDWQWCSPEHVAMVLATPSEWQGYEVRYLYAAPAHPAEGVPAQAESKIGGLLALARNMVRTALDADNKTEVQEIKAAIEAEVNFERGLRAALAATQPVAQVMEADLTDEQIDEAFNQMPDGAAGFLKSWGYRQFAHAVLAAQAKQGGAA